MKIDAVGIAGCCAKDQFPLWRDPFVEETCPGGGWRVRGEALAETADYFSSVSSDLGTTVMVMIFDLRMMAGSSGLARLTWMK